MQNKMQMSVKLVHTFQMKKMLLLLCCEKETDKDKTLKIKQWSKHVKAVVLCYREKDKADGSQARHS